MNYSLSNAVTHIQYAGGRSALTLQQIDESIASKQLLLRMHQLAHSAPDNADANALKALARKPVPAPSPKPEPVNAPLTSLAQDVSIVHNLALTTRLVTTCDGMNPSDFTVCLQVRGAWEWTTIVTYSYKNGKGCRHMHGFRGGDRKFWIDLPRSVVLEMAGEDLQRNWTAYCDMFLQQTPVLSVAASA
jgi:hypothetical protein